MVNGKCVKRSDISWWVLPLIMYGKVQVKDETSKRRSQSQFESQGPRKVEGVAYVRLVRELGVVKLGSKFLIERGAKFRG